MRYNCLCCDQRFDEARIAEVYGTAERKACPFCGSTRLEMSDARLDRRDLNDHLAEARHIVASWPEWKRNIGHRLDPIPPEELP
jgi:hypothetical protein